MEKQFSRKLYVLLGAWTLLTVVAVAAIVLIFRFDTIRTRTENDAASAVARVVGPVLARETPNLSEEELANFTIVAQALLGDQMQAIRLWSSDGVLLAATGSAPATPPDVETLTRVREGFVESFRDTTSRGEILMSYAPMESGAILEIQQDYAPIGASVASSRRILLFSVTASVLVLLILVQAMLWAITHDLKREYQRLIYLLRSGQAIRSTLDLTDVLEQLARDVTLFTRAQVGFATLLEEGSDDLILKASFERENNTASQHYRKVEEWFLRRCAATRETVTATQDNFPYRSLLGYEPEQQRAINLLCVVIPGHERAIGVVTMLRDRSSGSFKTSEVLMVEEMAAQAAMAVEQAVLFAKVRSYANEVEISYDSTLRALMAALDAKDAVTQGHSERVSRLTVTVAKEMGIPNEQIVDIERGALLHDIGKIGVPDEVLRKPEALNEGEWEAMQKHPLLAGLMISKVEFLEGALPILLYHHERYDGAGYPFGLQGTNIPLEARIFTVVDAYDAMTSDRPYRKAMPIELAMQEIRRNAETQFDPEVVEAFTRVMARMQPVTQRAA